MASKGKKNSLSICGWGGCGGACSCRWLTTMWSNLLLPRDPLPCFPFGLLADWRWAGTNPALRSSSLEDALSASFFLRKSLPKDHFCLPESCCEDPPMLWLPLSRSISSSSSSSCWLWWWMSAVVVVVVITFESWWSSALFRSLVSWSSLGSGNCGRQVVWTVCKWNERNREYLIEFTQTQSR